MEAKFDSLVARIESSFNRWLEEFDTRPVKTGLKLLIVVVVLRWLYKKFVG